MDRHHNAPPLKDRLALDYDALAQEVATVPEEVPPPLDTEEAVAAYSAQAKDLKTLAAKIEKARKAEKDAFLRDGKTVDEFFATLAQPVKDAADAYVSEINAWQSKKLKEERERQRKEAEAARIFEAEPVAPVVVKDAARVLSSSGNVAASASTVWLHRVTDPAKVPRVYLQVSDAAIKAAIAGGAREIPGVEIYEQVKTRIV